MSREEAAMSLGRCLTLALLLGLLTAAPGGTQPSGVLDLMGALLDGRTVREAAGGELWTLTWDEGRGAQVQVTPDGGLALRGHLYGEALATLSDSVRFEASDYVFQTRFVLTQPQGFYCDMLIFCPRVGSGADAPAYRIAYRFVGPCAVANNHTGFYLLNTGTEDYRQGPLYSTPMAGARYRLAYDREYVATMAVRDVAEGVNLRFFLHDTTLSGDDAQPLFEYTDTAPTRIVGDGRARVQVGSGGLITPAAPVWFGGMRLYPIDRLDEALQRREPTANLPTAELAVPPAPQRTELPNLFSDNMVLQQGKPVEVWGRGIDGDRVTVTLDEAMAQAAVIDGHWRLRLDPPPAGGPYPLTVTGRDRTIALQNVMVGEVWVLGGQSNMGWWLESTTEAATEVPSSDLPNLRVFSGWHPSADQPQFEMAGGSWKVVSPALEGHFSAVGYYLGKALLQRLGVPVGLIDTSTPATTIECWMSPQAALGVYGPDLYARPGQFLPTLSDPSCHYLGKVAPVQPVGIAGIVWYQADAGPAEYAYRYRRYLPALIEDWRRGFGRGDVPFLVVQIPKFKATSPEIRESQLLTALHGRNVGLAVTIDTGDPDDIHPREKRPVGERLALLARAIAYGEPIECMGPVWRGLEVAAGKAYLSFDHVGTGLALRGSGGFEVCGADRQYVSATAEVVEGDRLVVWSEAAPEPVAVRYAWSSVPEVSLYNREGLPASPFRTSEP